ncbi:hypothetical protein D3C78_1440140 [compost metagenome]
MIVVDVERLAVSTAVAVLLIAQVRQRVKYLHAAALRSLILNTPNEGVASLILLASDDHLHVFLAHQHGPAQSLRNWLTHFRERPHQVERMLSSHLAYAFHVVTPELLQILWSLRRSWLRKINQGLPGALDSRPRQLPHHIQRSTVDQDNGHTGEQRIQILG